MWCEFCKELEAEPKCLANCIKWNFFPRQRSVFLLLFLEGGEHRCERDDSIRRLCTAPPPTGDGTHNSAKFQDQERRLRPLGVRMTLHKGTTLARDQMSVLSELGHRQYSLMDQGCEPKCHEWVMPALPLTHVWPWCNGSNAYTPPSPEVQERLFLTHQRCFEIFGGRWYIHLL